MPMTVAGTLQRMASFRDQFDPAIWKVVAEIPPGSVMGYGEVARAAGFPRYSRMVSAAMGRSPEPLPWHRVVRSNRTLAFDPGTKNYRQQATLLRDEGVTFEGRHLVEAPSAETLDQLLWGPE